MPVTSLSDTFLKNIQLLTSYGANAFEGVTQKGQRKWMTPDDSEWGGSVFVLSGPTGVSRAFKREDINNMYVTAIQTAGQAGGGRVADTRVAKTQNDYLASQERAYRLRIASPIRCMMHAAARRAGHSSGDGVFNVIIKNLNDTLANGWQNNPNSPLG